MEHVPVLLKEAIDGLAVKKGGRYVDGTFGRGGHSREIVRRGGEVLGIDRDDAAVAAAGDLRVVKGNHGEIERIAHENGWNEVDGVLLDLGVWMKPDVASAFSATDPLTCAWIGRSA